MAQAVKAPRNSPTAMPKTSATSNSLAGDEVPPALDERGERVELATASTQPREQVQRHVDRREEQDDEHRHLHRRPSLDRAQPQRDARGHRSPRSR